jgi:IclR family acetate operon transcriptional repressor
MLPKAARERVTAELALARYTATTITEHRRLDAELARIRTARYATDNEEYHAGLVCLAVPVMDERKRACAALAVQAPVSRMSLSRALEQLPKLRHAAAAMAGTFS